VVRRRRNGALGGVLDTVLSSSYPEGEFMDLMLVQFDLDATEYWNPASWCDPLEGLEVWEAENVVVEQKK
jgi:hypothetical protein